MKNSAKVVLMSALSLFAITLIAADDKLAGLKCPVSGGKINAEKFVMHNGGKVYFCCENCPKSFEKDVAKFAPKANLQLAQSGQSKQTKCPLSGGKLNPEKTVEIGGVKVQFCCEKCQGKVAGMKGDEQIAAVFADDVFKKAFQTGERKKLRKKGDE
ncbi:MAG: hypothetical protein U0903_10890 [Planctomycetales bacterium]